MLKHIALAFAVVLGAARAHAQSESAFAATDRIFDEYRLDAHIPGLVYGIVADGKLVHVKAFGIQDTEAKRPVTADTLFRIASMTKAFTALTVLKLRDDGKLRLDALAEDYVPELKGWTYLTEDSPRITVRDLLSHVGGFVTDDPWGDRQTPMPDADFTKLLTTGVPFTRAPGMVHEYSNFGYAILGRVITNVSKQPFADTITQTLLTPLGMSSSGFMADKAPAERRALGYRWEDGAWKLEPFLAHGAFGAMGGLQTSANDYAKWIAYLLSAWPPRDGADAGPVKRGTVRDLSEGLGFATARVRPGTSTAPCQQALFYGKGFRIATDCELGLTMAHGGGYPGYGSHVLLLPERGVGIFAFANRTYAGPADPAWNALVALMKAGQLKDLRELAVSADLATSYKAAATIFTAGDIRAGGDILAMNVLLDRDPDHWARDLTLLKATVGACDTSAPVTPTGAMSGTFRWRCDHGRVRGSILLSPDKPARVQRFEFAAITP
jgi:D-alanyl-D-alanine-carboxypeptidase/D-alanyl-D-alanine-endopeptidase